MTGSVERTIREFEQRVRREMSIDVAKLCHWEQNRDDMQDRETHSQFHFGHTCPYFAVAEVLAGRPDPRDLPALKASVEVSPAEAGAAAFDELGPLSDNPDVLAEALDDYAELDHIYRALRARLESALDCVRSARWSATKDEADAYLRRALAYMGPPNVSNGEVLGAAFGTGEVPGPACTWHVNVDLIDDDEEGPVPHAIPCMLEAGHDGIHSATVRWFAGEDD
jgi:hypothetical protein